VDARLAALQFLNLHNHTYQWARSASRRWPARQLSAEYCRTLLHGMARDHVDLDEVDAALEQARSRLDRAAGPDSDAVA